MTRAAQPVSVTVVDDQPVALDILERAARAWNYDIQTAASAEQALALLERRLTPIIITDLRMPGRGGLWLVKEVRRRWPEVGIIVLTAGSDADAAEQCLRAGANHYFFKPINLDELRHVLGSTWQTYQTGQETRRRRSELEQAVRRQTRRVRLTFLSAINSLVRALEERDPYTAGHSQRVRTYSLALADELGLDKRTRRQLALAAHLHDLGKVGVPEAVLNKPDRLDSDEMRLVRQHPVIGERILKPVVRNRTVLAGIRGHHEHLNGGGYPDGLRGEAIPLLARLIAIPDCFDALTTSRAYRDALPPEAALDIIRLSAGAQYEPVFVNAFLRLAQRGALPMSVAGDSIEIRQGPV
jgi:putative two-component system response regulator